MKKIILTVFAALALSASNASAFGVTFEFDGLNDWGRTYDFDGGAGTWTPNNTNPYTSSGSQVLTNGTPSAPDGTEDSYGVIRVNRIIADSTGDVIFDRAVDSFELTTFFYGFDDVFLGGTFSFARLLSSGGYADLYKDVTPDYTPSTPPAPGAGRTAIDQFSTVTDGEKVLSLKGHSIIDPDTGAEYVLENFFSFASLSGFGGALFDVTGGSWASLFDTDQEEDGADLAFNFASFPNRQNNDWTVTGTGNAEGNVIPEPASMVLFSAGLLGAAGLRRKKIIG